jgi:hypothetical protein
MAVKFTSKLVVITTLFYGCLARYLTVLRMILITFFCCEVIGIFSNLYSLLTKGNRVQVSFQNLKPDKLVCPDNQKALR